VSPSFPIPNGQKLICTDVVEQMEKDIESAKKNLEEGKSGVAKLKKELVKLNEQVATSEVGISVCLCSRDD